MGIWHPERIGDDPNADEDSQQQADLGVPEVPGPVTALELAATAAKVTVSWQPPEVGEAPTRYIVQLRPEGGRTGIGKTKNPKAKKTQVTFKKLKPGVTYNVWVRAQNQAGKGERVSASIRAVWHSLKLTKTLKPAKVSRPKRLFQYLILK